MGICFRIREWISGRMLRWRVPFFLPFFPFCVVLRRLARCLCDFPCAVISPLPIIFPFILSFAPSFMPHLIVRGGSVIMRYAAIVDM
ncbi:hypothetical protein FB451DRAFT_1234933 [Mycena latifolia]|nr:hypothetical protein FB451DRAFT_1234933 [Mycena latifolia]